MDTNKFKESDASFFIQVKVINQILESPDVTEFNPIKDLPPGDFTEVFGDSFISGFVSGGEFNALICFKSKDKSKVRDIKAEAQVSLNALGKLSLEAQGQVDMKNAERNKDMENTISVSWSGGGEIKDRSVDEWTIAALKKAAIDFPDKVAAMPQRTQ